MLRYRLSNAYTNRRTCIHSRIKNYRTLGENPTYSNTHSLPLYCYSTVTLLMYVATYSPLYSAIINVLSKNKSNKKPNSIGRTEEMRSDKAYRWFRHKTETLVSITVYCAVICTVLMKPPSTCAGHPILPRLIIFVQNKAHTAFVVIDLFPRGTFHSWKCWWCSTSNVGTSLCSSRAVLSLCLLRPLCFFLDLLFCSLFLLSRSLFSFFPLLFFLPLLHFLPLLPLFFLSSQLPLASSFPSLLASQRVWH